MTPRQATIYQLWCGEKLMAGGEMTEDEKETMLIARKVTLAIAHRIMRITPSDYEYHPGKGFGET